MICSNCGKEIPEETLFCPDCGTFCQQDRDGLMEEATVILTPTPADLTQYQTAEKEPYPYTQPSVATAVPIETYAPEPTVAMHTPTPAPATSKPVKYRKKRPHMAIRAVFQFLSFVLCMVLMVTMVAAVALVDLRMLTSSNGLEAVIKAVFSGNSHHTSVLPPEAPAKQAASGLAAVSLSDVEYEFNTDDIPQDLLTGDGSEESINDLVGWLYEELQDAVDVELEFTKEELQEFVDESTVTEYLAEKMAGFADDFINGTENTAITTEELMQLLEENEAILEQKLKIRLSEDDKKQLQEVFTEVVEEEKLNETIRETVNETVNEVLQGTVGVDFAVVQAAIQQVTSDYVLYGVLGVCLALILLLCALNYYNVGAGFSWSAAAGILAGGLVCLPLTVLQFGRDVLLEMQPALADVMGTVDALIAPLVPIHYGLLLGSLAVFLLSIVWRIIAWDCNRKRPVKP